MLVDNGRPMRAFFLWTDQEVALCLCLALRGLAVPKNPQMPRIVASVSPYPPATRWPIRSSRIRQFRDARMPIIYRSSPIVYTFLQNNTENTSIKAFITLDIHSKYIYFISTGVGTSRRRKGKNMNVNGNHVGTANVCDVATHVRDTYVLYVLYCETCSGDIGLVSSGSTCVGFDTGGACVEARVVGNGLTAGVAA